MTDLEERAKQERRERRIQTGAFWLTGVALVLGVITLTQVLSGNEVNRGQVRSDAISACRSSYYADVERARTSLEAISAERIDLIGRMLGAFAVDDEDLVREVGLILATTEGTVDALLADLHDASDAYQSASDESAIDVDEFLDQCEEQRRIRPLNAPPAPTTTVRAPTTTTTTTASTTTTTRPQGAVSSDGPHERPTTTTTPPTTTTSTTSPTTTTSTTDPDEPTVCELAGVACRF